MRCSQRIFLENAVQQRITIVQECVANSTCKRVGCVPIDVPLCTTQRTSMMIPWIHDGRDLIIERLQTLITPRTPIMRVQDEAIELQNELLNEYGYSLAQITEIAGLGSATAIVKSYPLESLTKAKGTVLIVCGPGFNGAVGLVCARYLRIFDYRPTIFYPRRATKTALYNTLADQCELQHIPFLSYMPSEAHLITSAYNIIVDSLFGTGFRGPTPEPDMAAVIQTMIRSGVPVVSIDIPSGWTVDSEAVQLMPTDDPAGDSSTTTVTGGADDSQMLNPDVLISLTAPKRCSRAFRGRRHYVVQRFLPPELLHKYELGSTDVDVNMCAELNLVEVDARDANSTTSPICPQNDD